MKLHIARYARLGMLLMLLAGAPQAVAVDFESFEFNDPVGTTLGSAANTANPGNTWVENPDMEPSDIRGGVYNIVKQTSGLDSNYLQIDNITSGTRYLVATMSGWDFFQNSIDDPGEEFRLAFLDNDTGDSGATITAQMNIRRDPADSGNIILEGTALGDGTDIPSSATLNTTQSNPFTMVLELNKNANSYKVYYKDGANPTQVLGLGALDPGRDGNSLRMAVNNSFGEFSDDYPLEFFEVFSIDRIAVTDTNPLTDLIKLEVNREAATLTLRNNSGTNLAIESYSITSAAGALDPSGWNPGSASPTISTNEELAATYGAPFNLANNGTLSLSTPLGAWIQSPIEDLQMVLNLSGGATRTVSVDFLMNGGMKWMEADFDFDNDIDAADFLALMANAETDLSGLSLVEQYLGGDLAGEDGLNSIADFVRFKELYEMANPGAGSFEAMVAGLTVPEPTGLALVCITSGCLALGRRRRLRADFDVRTDSQRTNDHSKAGERSMARAGNLVLTMFVGLLVTLAGARAEAAILEDFMFEDDNGVLINEAANSINPSNTWLAHANAVESAVLDGSYRIQKQSATSQASNVLDIANIVSGKAWLVAEIAGWNYTATASSPSERVRFGFLDNDMPTTGSSTVTAEATIDRGGTGLVLNGGALGTGASNIQGSYALDLVRSDPFTIALELDKDADMYSVYFKDDEAPYALLGTGDLGEKIGSSTLREGNSLRFAFTGTFGDVGEFFDVDRIYLTDVSPIVDPLDPTVLSLEVKSNGQVSIVNNTNASISFNSYRITSPDANQDLNFAGWETLGSQGFDEVDGPDLDSIVGNGVGEGWTAAGGSDDTVLAESFLHGSTTLNPTDSRPLGNAFKVNGNHELLEFQYHDINTGVIVSGEIDFVVSGLEGDYNEDGKVDAADYVVWRRTDGSPSGYTTWRANFGMSAPGSGGQSLAAVPEPSAWWLVAIALLALAAPVREPAGVVVPARSRAAR